MPNLVEPSYEFAKVVGRHHAPRGIVSICKTRHDPETDMCPAFNLAGHTHSAALAHVGLTGLLKQWNDLLDHTDAVQKNLELAEKAEDPNEKRSMFRTVRVYSEHALKSIGEMEETIQKNTYFGNALPEVFSTLPSNVRNFVETIKNGDQLSTTVAASEPDTNVQSQDRNKRSLKEIFEDLKVTPEGKPIETSLHAIVLQLTNLTRMVSTLFISLKGISQHFEELSIIHLAGNAFDSTEPYEPKLTKAVAIAAQKSGIWSNEHLKRALGNKFNE